MPTDDDAIAFVVDHAGDEPDPMRNVTPIAASAASAPAKKPAPAPLQEITPMEPLPLSPKMRALLGRSPYRDPSTQVQADAMLLTICREVRARGFLQAKLADDLTHVMISKDQARSAIQTAINRARPRAAREILCPGWASFHPPAANAVRTNGMADTAFGTFMESGGDAVARLSDEQAIDGAIAELAGRGEPEAVLDSLARIHILPMIEALEKQVATYQGEQEALIEQLLRLLDRRVQRGLDKGD